MKSLVFFAVAALLLWFLGAEIIGPGSPSSGAESVVEVKVEGIFLAPGTASPVVVLREQAGERSVPIWVGYLEAEAIRQRLAHEEPPRPTTHDLLGSAVAALGGQVKRIVVTELREGTFYARVDLDTSHDPVSLDARPSDAIALALRTAAPIFVARTVIDEAGETDLILGPPDEAAPGLIGCGIWCQPIDEELGRALQVQKGVVVSDLSPQQQAAGRLQRGDVIVEIAGQGAENPERARELMAGAESGKAITLTIMRDGERREIEITCP